VILILKPEGKKRAFGGMIERLFLKKGVWVGRQIRLISAI